MLACHRSQLFEWLAYEADILDTVPEDEADKVAWVQAWVKRHIAYRADRWLAELIERFGQEKGKQIDSIEVFEISEYAHQPDAQRIADLFPTGKTSVTR